ncbi:signal peptide protein [Bacillus infantis]
MSDIIMVSLFIILPALMLGLASWSAEAVKQGSENE